MTAIDYPTGAIFGPTLGIARDMQAEPLTRAAPGQEFSLGGGDLNGTAATLFFGHAGTAGEQIGLPRLGNPNLGIASAAAPLGASGEPEPPSSGPPEGIDLPEPPGESGEAVVGDIEPPLVADAAPPEPERQASETEPEPEPPVETRRATVKAKPKAKPKAKANERRPQHAGSRRRA